jgi:hypothetical protein
MHLEIKSDGVAKTHQLLRCCNCSRHCGVPKYASFLDNCAPCIWRFLLSHSLFCFLAKASNLTPIDLCLATPTASWGAPKALPRRVLTSAKTRVRPWRATMSISPHRGAQVAGDDLHLQTAQVADRLFLPQPAQCQTFFTHGPSAVGER